MDSGSLEELREYLGSTPIDAFFCSASFEERSRTIAAHIDPCTVRCAWIAHNVDFLQLSAESLRFLEKRFKEHLSVAIDTSNPLLTADSIAASVAPLCDVGQPRILVDITSFTRESLLILLRFLSQSVQEGCSLELIYANASEYSVGDGVEEKWLSRGTREVRSVLGYPGVLAPSRESHLIVLLGFEDERALNLIREWEPARVSLGIGDESEVGTVPHQATNVASLQRLKTVVGPVAEFAFPGFDAFGTREAIEELIGGARGYNTIVAPMNTKISTVGVAMVALRDESVQICYAQPNYYNTERYSTPGDRFYCFRFR